MIGLAVLWGIWALVDGIGLFGVAFGGDGTSGQRVLAGAMAAIVVLAGLYAIVHPAGGGRPDLGDRIWLLVRGVFELVGAFGSGLPGSSRWIAVLSAVVDSCSARSWWPTPERVGITWLLGIVALIWGVVLIVLALVVRSRAHDLRESGPTPAPA